MKPKLTGLEKLSPLEREAFEMYAVWREHSLNVPTTIMDWKYIGLSEQNLWLRLARRVRRKVAKARKEGHEAGWGHYKL